jgi:major capsid protein gp7
MAFLSLADVGRRFDPRGRISDMANLLSQCNEMINDIPMVEANGLTSHTTTIVTSLPKGTYIRYYQGTPYTKSNAAQVEFGMSLLRDYSQVDKRLISVGGQSKTLRRKEDTKHMEGLSQQQAQTLMYGNTWTTPQQFTGWSPLFNTVSTATAQNAVNVFDCGGTGSSNASIWLIGWGDSTAYGIYPQGSQGGLVFEDKGDVVPGFDVNNYRFEAETSLFEWQLGLVVEDWRFSLRLCNIDTTTAGLLGSAPPDLFAILSRAIVRLPTAGRMQSGITQTDDPEKMSPSVRLKLYTDRTVRAAMDVQAIRDKNVLLSPRDYAGQPIVNFRNIPIGVMDSMLNTESRVV